MNTMKGRLQPWIVAILLQFSLFMSVNGQESVERGRKALTETAFIPASWTTNAYENLWKRWPGVTSKPENYVLEIEKRYGLPTAPYENDQLPMGLRAGKIFFAKGIAIDCMICHGGSLFSKSYVGLGNTSIDLQGLFEDLSISDGRSGKLPFQFGNVRGTTEAFALAVYLISFRDAELKVTSKSKNLGLHDDMCLDPPAWWLLKKKSTMYCDGGMDARSIRSKMQFMMSPLTSRKEFDRHEAAFKDIHEFLMSMEAPKYPKPINEKLAASGNELFSQNCASCHGTYGAGGKYPNKIVPLEKIGTDPHRHRGLEDRYRQHYNETWFAKESPTAFPAIKTVGYQAPPLDGIWATAPYFHNGSVPTLMDVLDSTQRPKRYTRTFQTREEDYDFMKVGWKTTPVGPEKPATPRATRQIYDTSLPGRSNQGHTFGDHLTEQERLAVIEYLKTL
ncbi:MAG: c-type cytochrome [Zavarzinella sp.]